jgi:hypothetical protein
VRDEKRKEQNKRLDPNLCNLYDPGSQFVWSYHDSRADPIDPLFPFVLNIIMSCPKHAAFRKDVGTFL